MVMMEEVYLGLKIPSTLLLTILEKFFMVMEEVDIGIRTATLPPITQVDVVYCWVYLLFIDVFSKVFMVMKGVIVVEIVEDVDSDIKRLDTLTFKIVDKVLMVVREMDIGIRSYPLPPIIQVGLVQCWFYLFVVVI